MNKQILIVLSLFASVTECAEFEEKYFAENEKNYLENFYPKNDDSALIKQKIYPYAKKSIAYFQQIDLDNQKKQLNEIKFAIFYIDTIIYALKNSPRLFQDAVVIFTKFVDRTPLISEIEKEFKIYDNYENTLDKYKDRRAFYVLKYLNGFRLFIGYKKLKNELGHTELSTYPDEKEIEQPFCLTDK